MRRFWATFLLAMVSISLIEPVLVADTESRLPECCRRLGKHHCTMPAGSQETSGVGLKAAAVRCASFPSTTAARCLSNAMALVADRNDSIPAFAQLASYVHSRSLYRLSSDRSRHKRGPPSLFEKS